MVLLVSGVGSLLLLLKLAAVPLVKHEIPELDGGPEEVERDEETEGPGSVGQLADQSDGVEILHLEKVSSDLSGGEPAANNEEEDAEDQLDQESDQPEEEASEEEREVFPSILHSEASLHNPLLEGQGIVVGNGINILSEERIKTEFFADALVAYLQDLVRHGETCSLWTDLGMVRVTSYDLTCPAWLRSEA